MEVSEALGHNQLMYLLNTYREHLKGFKKRLCRRKVPDIGFGKNKLENGVVKLEKQATPTFGS